MTAPRKSRQELCDRYKITEEFLDHLISLAFLKPDLYDGRQFFDADDELRLEVVLKGREHGFSLGEIALLIHEQAPQLDGTKV